MRILTLALFGLSATLATASELTVDHVRDFFLKQPKCTLAVGALLNGAKDKVFDKVYCVVDMTHGAGSIHEARGCTFALYNLHSDLYERPYGSDPMTMHFGFVRKKCSDGGFEELLKQEAFWETYHGKGRPISYAITWGILAQLEKETAPNTVMLFSGNAKFREWWEAARKKATFQPIPADQ
jgi:hypothetical protein